MNHSRFFRRVSDLLAERRTFAVARLLACEGSVPQSAGAGMIVFADGTIEFTIGGGPFEAAVIKDSIDLIGSGGIVHKSYGITQKELGMYCCGRAEVLIEVPQAPWELWIFGGGHIGKSLARLAAQIGAFIVTVFDDRPEYAAVERHVDADRVVLTDRDYQHGVSRPGVTTCVVITTRCHQTDKKLVARFSGCEMAYFGMVGSAKKRRTMLKELMAEGASASGLDRLETPAGLPIGGKSPEEVALSILSRVVQVKNDLESSTGARRTSVASAERTHD